METLNYGKAGWGAQTPYLLLSRFSSKNGFKAGKDFEHWDEPKIKHAYPAKQRLRFKPSNLDPNRPFSYLIIAYYAHFSSNLNLKKQQKYQISTIFDIVTCQGWSPKTDFRNLSCFLSKSEKYVKKSASRWPLRGLVFYHNFYLQASKSRPRTGSPRLGALGGASRRPKNFS